jgi:hypothetical protein
MLARLGRHARLLVTMAFVLVSVAAVLVRPPMEHWSPDGDGKYIQMTSIRVEGGRLRYDVPYVGKSYDPRMAAVPLYCNYYDIRSGEIRIAWPELFVLATYPLHAAFGWLGLFILPLAAGAVCVHLTGVIAERIRKGTGWIAALVVAVATPVLVYSTLFWEHTPALALAMGAVLLLVGFFSDGNRGRVFAAGALMGFASAGLRGEMSLLTAALVGGAFLATPGRRRWWVPAFATVGFVIGSAPVWAMNYATSGRILPSNAVKSVPKGSLAALNPEVLPHFFVGKLATNMSPLAAWTTALAPFLLCVAYYIGRRAGDERWRAAVMIAAASAFVPASLVEISPAGLAMEDRFHGWLAMCPVLALGMLVSRVQLPQASALARQMVLCTAVLYAAIVALVLGILDPEETDLEWGPRYWIALFPLTAILVAVSYDAFIDAVRPLLGKRALVIPVALFLVGVIFIVVGMARIHYEVAVNRLRSRLALASNGPEPLLTDAFWISPMDFENYVRRPSFFVDIHRPDHFPPWLCEAKAHGLTSFDLVTGLVEPMDHPFLMQPLDCGVHVVAGDVRYTGILKFLHVRIEPGQDQRRYGRYRVYGLIYAKYVAIGEQNSYLGLPTSGELGTVAFCGGGRYVAFQHGRIDFCPNVGAWAHDDPTQPYPGRDR